jgi:hypothetical protein
VASVTSLLSAWGLAGRLLAPWGSLRLGCYRLGCRRAFGALLADGLLARRLIERASFGALGLRPSASIALAVAGQAIARALCRWLERQHRERAAIGTRSFVQRARSAPTSFAIRRIFWLIRYSVRLHLSTYLLANDDRDWGRQVSQCCANGVPGRGWTIRRQVWPKADHRSSVPYVKKDSRCDSLFHQSPLTATSNSTQHRKLFARAAHS